ncbi:MAG: SPASM domain-containing protein [Candidatus Wallbacteria bacterium]|nr:SPASM domain-containing protein [Candidatus Wallbacteria bacterium]
MIKHLQLALTNYCNLDCIMCPHTLETGMREKHEFLPLGVLQKILECDVGFQTIYSFYLGEPLAHPDFYRIMELLFSRNLEQRFFQNIEFYTNGTYLNPDLTSRLFSLLNCHREQGRIGRIYFSLDAVTEETYHCIRRNGELKKVEENVLNFLSQRKKSGLDYPKVSLCFLVMPENHEETRKFAVTWQSRLAEFGDAGLISTLNNEEFSALGKMGDNVFIRPLRSYKGDQEEMDRLFLSVSAELGISAISTREERELDNSVGMRSGGRNNPCAHPFTSPLIDADGTLLPCCQDNRRELSLGSLHHENFREIWWGEKAYRLRKAHLNRDLSEFECCRNCSASTPLKDDDWNEQDLE